MNRIRFFMVGGFLGAGKTTALARLARHYMAEGLRVGLVTNDQAFDLVDTQTLRAQGFAVGEVTGACFCCKFNDLLETVQKLGESDQPQIILAEPVGSCTDLVATVVEPLRLLYQDAFEVGPLIVLLKPEHGQKILSDSNGVGFSPKAAYIFLKQIEEADVVALNKIDKLDAAAQRELLRLVGERFPEKTVLPVSARTGDGFDELRAAMAQPRQLRDAMMTVDYDIYAEGEAELGWLNCVVKLTRHDDPFPLDEAVEALVRQLQDALAAEPAEPAHLKVMGQGADGWAVANLVSSGNDVELSQASGTKTAHAELIVNARVALDPQRLATIVEQQVERLGERLGAASTVDNMQRFRPGRPEPTHRIGAQG